ncbi:hypothetical protein [Stenomitos frigidus]|uniref:Membrane-anchored protein n=1 Tax=Stenomitos frigidus ULC18 TaxID=2107698 RepID=A0A2T1E0Y0_9CYAN|nr:hypothetical protein [Stenomitos frigidus]PSB26392.1 hypothetical protein C7B82_19980 [Stenomitos frigidus ULC18]
MSLHQGDENTSLLSKVPEVTIYFWIIKILCTTVGETASDFLNVSLGFGLTGTSMVVGVVLLIALFFQFKAKKYTPALYWLTVVLISIFGTLFTDNLTDKLGIALEVSTTIFSIALALTFAAWFSIERTLSIHSIFTRRRESFYWLAILVTFALGTATGDLMAESLGLGYLTTGIIVAVVIAFVTIAWRFGLNPVLSFWLVYIMTRPLGASLGDFLSQPRSNGGLGLGATVTSAIFMAAILLTVIFLSITKRDLITHPVANVETNRKRYTASWQIALAVSALVITAGSGYYWRHTELQHEAIASTSSTSPLGELSSFRTIAADTLSSVQKGNLSAATARVGDLEVAWDKAQSRLKPMNPSQWSSVDKSIDHVLRQLRAQPPDPTACKTSLESLLSTLDALDQRQSVERSQLPATANFELRPLTAHRSV